MRTIREERREPPESGSVAEADSTRTQGGYQKLEDQGYVCGYTRADYPKLIITQVRLGVMRLESRRVRDLGSLLRLRSGVYLSGCRSLLSWDVITKGA